LDQASLTAPVAGVVGEVNISVGQSAAGSGSNGSGSSGTASASSTAASSTSTTHAITLLTPGAFQVTGTVSDSQINEIAIGQRARVLVAGATEAATGKVTGVSPVATVTSGVASFAVTIVLDGSNPSLHAGTSASIAVVVNQAVEVLTVPTSAVSTAGGISTVQVLVNGSPQTRTVQLGASDALRTEVDSGLNPGDQVVIATVSGTVPTNTGGGIFGGGRGAGGGGVVRGGGGAARPGG
ncbi:MAG: HlyD family efflux transporter periplasmic adaptor subunit, partial [Chloroflexi bacterium]